MFSTLKICNYNGRRIEKFERSVESFSSNNEEEEINTFRIFEKSLFDENFHRGEDRSIVAAKIIRFIVFNERILHRIETSRSRIKPLAWIYLLFYRGIIIFR